MIKSEMQIERDFYSFLKSSPVGKAIRGEVYRSEMRPYGATSEDLVIKFLAGIDDQIQTGIVILNLYVPDIAYGNNGRKVADKNRIAELQELILTFIQQNCNTEYLMETESSPVTMYNEDIEQHLICARIKFQRITI